MFIKIDPALFEKQSDYLIGVVVAEGIDNAAENKEINDLLNTAIAQQKQALSGQAVKQLKELEPYHAAMRNFGISVSRFLPSIEALLTRLVKSGDLPSISPVVNLTNAISLQYHVPIGTHDIDSLIGDLEIRQVKSDDIADFKEESSGFDNGEIVYASGNSIRTRRWIWRQMPAGLTSKDTKNVVFPIDGFSGNVETILEARDALVSKLQHYFGCNTRVGLIQKDSPSFEISGLSGTAGIAPNLIQE